MVTSMIALINMQEFGKGGNQHWPLDVYIYFCRLFDATKDFPANLDGITKTCYHQNQTFLI